jgi:hypothetical protein
MAFEPTWMDGAEIRAGRDEDAPVEDDTTSFPYYGGTTNPAQYTADTFLSDACYRFNFSSTNGYLLLPSGGAQAGSGLNTDDWNVDGDSQWVGFHFKVRTSLPSDNTNFATFTASGLTNTDFRFMNDGTIDIVHNSGTDSSTGTISADTWYACAITAGRNSPIRIIVKNPDTGSTVIDKTAGSNHPNNLSNVVVGPNQNETVDLLIDNVIACCETEAGQTGNPFDVYGARWVIYSLSPSGAGTRNQQDTGTYADVDELPHDSSTTIATEGTTGHRMTVAMSDFAPDTGEIAAVMPILCSEGSQDVDVSMYIGSTDYDSGTAQHPASYKTREWLTLVNPDTAAAWTTSDLTSLEVGFQKAGGVGTHDVTGIHLEYLCEQAAPSGNQMILVM